eukprot:CAMPEP_0197188352 /NCGR_PEP_ID=MMETSP1423-20130617/17661_1 /TAXON_ID=476441 /ORGANISM="Pseudo-nitzschia heimii, Strain UNC1101" /LENGTH=873 /DNA_ID=CAMNT_0042640159 /DNA_START=22 /DNA_END=2643 /DNA_ORIENTATION=+
MSTNSKRNRITTEDKDVIRETVSSLLNLKNSGPDNNENFDRVRAEEKSNLAVWKTLAFVLFGIVILFATDIVEFKKVGSQNKHEIITGVVEKKVVHVPESTPAPVPIPVPGLDPDPDPVPSPASVKPIEIPPTARPTAEVTSAAKTTKEVQPVEVETTAKRHTYKTRGQPMSDKDRKEMEDKWGKWTLENDTKGRPTDDYYVAYPNRDIPRSNFPSNAWQIDKEYLSKFLPESIKLIDRATNAILEEYGQPLDGTSDLFHFEKYDEWNKSMDREPCYKRSGCTLAQSFENLKRRLLHAIMTEDIFVVAMGGHSSSAGHGNHFTQSYTLQVQWILEAVFSRLGVRHQSRNIGLGGLGTTQTGVATKQILGHDVDMLMWDSGMTEKEPKARDMFFRQGILGGGKVPMLMTLSSRHDVMSMLNKNADADIFMLGDQSVIAEANTLDEVKELPWASQYVRCGSEISGICRDNEYMGQCWIERDDFEPPTKQGKIGGRAKWHPGNRKHQIIGRSIAFIILQALKEVLTMWNDAKDYNLADDTWHVTSMYDNTRSKVEKLGPDVGSCNQYKDEFTDFMCNTAVKARGEFTPRAYPDFTNIRTLMPPSQAEHINDPPETIYDAPDVFNQNLHPPAEAVDVLNIVEAGIPFTPVLVPDYTQFYSKPKFEKDPILPVGKGYYLNTYAGYCDGSVDSWCRREAENECLLYGHNDGRKGIKMDSYCGWMVTNLPEFKHGFIAVKIETWHAAKSNPKTEKWTSINNERRNLNDEREGSFLRSSSSSSSKNMNNTTYYDEERQLKAKVPDYCPEFKFEFAIDGKITSWDKEMFLKNMGHIQRVVEILKVVEDPTITDGVEKEIEFAFRITGCTNQKMMHLTHIYWA